MTTWDDAWEDDEYPEKDPPCATCDGRGKIPTLDYESYLGASYKPCPDCGGDPCIGEPPLS